MNGREGDLQLVTFQLGPELYGVDIMRVREIAKLQEIRQIPNAPPYVEGIINLRGKIIPLINLHRRFNIRRAETAEEDRLLSGFLIVEVNGTLLGMLIDKVSRVVTVEPKDIQSPPQMLGGIGKEYIYGVTGGQGRYLMILNVDRLFDTREFQQIGRLGG